MVSEKDQCSYGNLLVINLLKMGLYIDHNWDISVLRISELVFWDITVVV
jgi:hypothetical protein